MAAQRAGHGRVEVFGDDPLAERLRPPADVLALIVQTVTIELAVSAATEVRNQSHRHHVYAR